MNLKFLNYLCITTIFLNFFGVVGWAPATANGAVKNIPVSWDTGFTMPDLLASSDISLNNIGDLSKLIKAPWYAEVAVIHTRVGESVFSSCADYFKKVECSTRTARDSEMSAYLEFKIMCEATRLLINAKQSKESFLPTNILSDDAPKLWPKAMALQISTEESKRSTQNPALIFWADVTPIIKHERQSETKSIYYHKGGHQEIEIIGRGDANSDGVEDIFLVVRDHVESGNYFNMRLFVLSVDELGSWGLIKEI